MATAWLKRVRPWQVVAWSAVGVLLVLVILNTRRPDVDEAVRRAILPLILFPLADLVGQRRKGRSMPRSIGHALLSGVLLAAVFLIGYVLQLLFGRPPSIDPFSDSTIDPPASYVAVVIVICLAWAAVAKQLDLGPWNREPDR